MGLGLGFQLSGGRAVYAWPPALELAPGARLAWPLWVHPRVAGALDVSLAFCYEPVHAAPDGMKYRCACCEHDRPNRCAGLHIALEPYLRLGFKLESCIGWRRLPRVRQLVNVAPILAL